MKKTNKRMLLKPAIVLCAMAGAALAQSQPVIQNVYPDGSVQFQSTNKLAFVTTATKGVSNIVVQLTGSKMGGGSVTKIYSSASGLTLAATNGGKIVSAPLSSNMVYSASISVTDSNNATTTQTISFDTIRPVYTWEAEDYDYNSGQYIDNPQTNAYRGLAAVDGADAHNGSGGNQDYRPHDATSGGLATEVCGDTPRAQYINTGKTNYDTGWNNGGNWANYTRKYPNGLWNIYMRAANPNGAGSDSAQMSSLSFDMNITPRFAVPSTGGWQNYTWVPLVDEYGTLCTFYGDGTAQTIRLATTGGSYNANFFMLLPQAQGATPPDASVSEFAPDGTFQFQATNKLSFTVYSSLGVKAADVIVQLTATTPAGTTSTKVLQSGSGLTISGSPTSLAVTAPVTTNLMYTAIVQVTDANGTPISQTNSFDTISPAFTWEAEDWDYDGGKFIDNPAPNAYTTLNGVDGIDFARPSTGGGSAYNRVGLATENASDLARTNFVGFPDYDIGNNGGGNWVNYTRTWPAGVYNIYIRVANGNGTTANAGTISEVTSGAGTADQTVLKLGTYNSPGTGNWQKYNWQPVLDSGGNLVRFTGGSQKTLRHTVGGGNANQGFYMLIPADVTAPIKPFIDGANPDGSSMFQYTNTFSCVVHSAAGVSSNAVSVKVDGLNAYGVAITGSSNLWSVSCPVGPNAFHTVAVSVTDKFGSVTNTSSFTTFDPAATYVFEAEDWDFNGGQFIDNPAPNAYSGKAAVAEVDTHTPAGNADGTHQPYRPASSSGGLNQEGASDSVVTPAHSGIQNYDLGNTTSGLWANYTRTYPEGVYNIYMRAANGTGGSSPGGSMDIVTGGQGSPNQTVQVLGTFDNVPATGGWQTYTWVALKDANGNLAQFTGGSVETLRAICGGGQNMDYYALVPVDTSRPSLSGLYPDGSMMFQGTNKLSFVANSTAGIDTNSIVVTLNGVVVTNLAITGSDTSWTVSCANLQPNTTYTAVISFSSRTGVSFSKSLTIDTYSTSYFTWEAEDFDYTDANGTPGHFFDNPQVDSYNGFGFTSGIDGYQADPGANTFSYRPSTLGFPPGTPTAGDMARPEFANSTDYRLTWFGPGSWLNYTRHYPAGTYTIVGRFTEGATDDTLVTLSKVTAGFGTSKQTTSLLGTFHVSLIGWNTWEYATLVDDKGKPVTVTFDDSQTTLQLGGSPLQGAATINANFFMLVPVPVTAPTLKALLADGKVTLSFMAESGKSYQLQYKNDLNDATWTSLGSAVAGNGAAQNVNDTLTQGHRFYRVQMLGQ